MHTKQDLNEDRDGGFALNEQLDIDNAQLGVSVGVDFENNIWTFKMQEGFKAGAGGYMIIKM